MFYRTIQSIYRSIILALILVVGLIMLSHTGHTAEPEVWFSFKGKDADVAEDASGNGNDGVILGGMQRVSSKEGVYGMGIEFGVGGNNKFNYRVAASGANGVMDEFAIYSETLSAKDIQTEMDLRASSVEPEGKLAVTWGRIKSK